MGEEGRQVLEGTIGVGKVVQLRLEARVRAEGSQLATVVASVSSSGARGGTYERRSCVGSMSMGGGHAPRRGGGVGEQFGGQGSASEWPRRRRRRASGERATLSSG